MPSEEKQRFIVAEVTKNWYNNTMANSAELLSQRFENVINVNLQRGYNLVDWKISQVINNGIFTETIIAIFEFHNNESQNNS